MPYVPRPSPCILDDFEFYKVVGGRKVYRDDRLLYTWDELHGEVEVFDRRGRHLGAIDGVTGEKLKPAKRGRRLNV